MLLDRMRPSAAVATVMLVMLLQIVCIKPTNAEEPGTVIPAETISTGLEQLEGRPCVDCHAFEFMQRALQDLKKTAFNLDSRTESLVLRAERRALCDCMPTSSLR